MKHLFATVLILVSLAAVAQQHCGYDFTSYVVLHIHEDGKKENIAGLSVTLIDSAGQNVVNTANRFSWKMKDEVLRFSENYKIDQAGSKIEKEAEGQKFRWYFPFAKDTYLLSVTNEFPADGMRVKIEDPQGRYQTLTAPLFAYNLYILCSAQAQQQAQQFGARVNKPVNIVLAKK
jgi:hypothetical protein